MDGWVDDRLGHLGVGGLQFGVRAYRVGRGWAW